MNLLNEQNVEQTFEKIALLESHVERITKGETELNSTARDLSVSGLQRTIKQMKEDVARYHSRRQLKAV